MTIRDRVRQAMRERPKTTAVFLLAAAVTVFFAVRLLLGVLFWGPPGPRPLEPWMTVGVVGRMHHLDPREIDARAGLPLPDPRPYTLAQIAEDRGVPVEEIYALVNAAVVELKAREEAGGRGRDGQGRDDR
jgi:hypothetical protein